VNARGRGPGETKKKGRLSVFVSILGRDRDPRAIAAARANAERAGVAQLVHLEVGPLSTTKESLAASA
jgi:23S rRNA G2445 N2-methylase RlmL